MNARLLGLFSGFPTHHFPDAIAQALHENLPRRESLVFISAWPEDFARNDEDSDGMHGMFLERGMGFASHRVIDRRTSATDAALLVRKADCVFLMGGDAAKQMALIRDLGIVPELLSSRAVILGVSAGSMNMGRQVADVWETKALYDGINLTNITVKGHYAEDAWFLPTLKEMSVTQPIIAMEDESAIFIRENDAWTIGKIHWIDEGSITLLTDAMLKAVNRRPFPDKKTGGDTEMLEEKKTLGELLSDPRIGKIASDAIRNRDLSKEEVWNKTPKQLRDGHFFFGDLGRGFGRLFDAADTGDWYYPLYSEAECAEDEGRRNVNMVWFPSDDPEADERPFILLVPGGGFVNVWNLTEGWPVAAQFNSEGYHAFILTYQVDGEERLLEKDLGDIARALRLIREKEKHFHLRADRYITCGFSAGGMLVCLWNTEMGYPAFRLPKPQASFPVYPLVSLRLAAAEYVPEEDTEEDEAEDLRLYGCPFLEAMETPFESPEHAEGFPPCAIFVMAGDELLGHSKLLAAVLEKLHIPCRLEIGPEGGHGFADGTGTCIAGWTKRAVRWYEGLDRAERHDAGCGENEKDEA